MSDTVTLPRQDPGAPVADGLQVLTFLVTDIKGSSEAFLRHPAAMARTMELHDTVLHRAIRDQGGNPFKHT
ncbi:MAG: hypothetical protein AAGA78_12560, partial [Pseudomonadota bacterium]